MNQYLLLLKNKLVKQFFSLASIQVVNLLVPLLVIPYVSRILGPETLGIVNFATSFVTYFTLLINYGFDYSATRELSVAKDNISEANRIVNLTLTCKLYLFLVSSAIYFLIILSSERYSSEAYLYLASYITLISTIFYSTWIFQGFQKLSVLTSFNLTFRLLSVIATFVFVRHQDDYVIYQAITCVALLCTGIATLIVARKKFGINFAIARFKDVMRKLKDSFILFLSVAIVNFNTTSTIVLLGYLTDYYTVGCYTSAMKVYSVIASLSLFPISQVIFPHLAQKFNNSIEDGIAFVRKSIPLIMGGVTVVSCMIFLFAPFIIHTLYGDKFDSSIGILRVLAPLLIVSTLVNILCYQVLLNLKMDKYFLKINATASIFNIIITIFFVPWMKAYGTCLALYIIELAIIVISIVILNKRGIRLIKNR